MAALLLIACALGCTTGVAHKQVPDASFDALVAAPRFRGDGPRLLFDDAHQNFHRSDGRYAPFVTLMRNDGFVVTPNAAPFTAESLRGHDLLVIANARGASEDAPAFTDAEVDAVAAWVEGGGALLLIADHSPFGRAAAALSQRFGVEMLDAHLKDEAHKDPTAPSPFFLLFTRENGLLGEHAITRDVQRIVTFGGQALRVRGDDGVLLRLSPDARIVRDRAKPDDNEPVGANGAAAVALTHGRGRVAIIGEAAALTAQVITGDAAKAMGLDELRIGMSRTDLDNKQFALNVVRWLVGEW